MQISKSTSALHIPQMSIDLNEQSHEKLLMEIIGGVEERHEIWLEDSRALENVHGTPLGVPSAAGERFLVYKLLACYKAGDITECLIEIDATKIATGTTFIVSNMDVAASLCAITDLSSDPR